MSWSKSNLDLNFHRYCSIFPLFSFPFLFSFLQFISFSICAVSLSSTVIFPASRLYFLHIIASFLHLVSPGVSASLQTLHTPWSLPPKSTAHFLSYWYYPKLLCQAYPTVYVCMCVCVSGKASHNSTRVRWFLLETVQGHAGNEPNKTHLTSATGDADA